MNNVRAFHNNEWMFIEQEIALPCLLQTEIQTLWKQNDVLETTLMGTTASQLRLLGNFSFDVKQAYLKKIIPTNLHDFDALVGIGFQTQFIRVLSEIKNHAFLSRLTRLSFSALGLSQQQSFPYWKVKVFYLKTSSILHTPTDSISETLQHHGIMNACSFSITQHFADPSSYTLNLTPTVEKNTASNPIMKKKGVQDKNSADTAVSNRLLIGFFV